METSYVVATQPILPDDKAEKRHLGELPIYDVFIYYKEKWEGEKKW